MSFFLVTALPGGTVEFYGNVSLSAPSGNPLQGEGTVRLQAYVDCGNQVASIGTCMHLHTNNWKTI